MRLLTFGAAVILGVGVACSGLAATAAPLLVPRLDSPKIEPMTVEEVGYWRRRYWRHGYAVPYAYYPPAYGYSRLLLHTPTILPRRLPRTATMPTICPRVATTATTHRKWRLPRLSARERLNSTTRARALGKIPMAEERSAVATLDSHAEAGRGREQACTFDKEQETCYWH